MHGSNKIPSSRLESLDALRGFAAFAVAWFHIFQKSGEPTIQSETLYLILDMSSAYGWLGVPAFFVLTGFIIPFATFRSPASTQNALLYLQKRFFRLYPAFAATVILALGITFAAVLVPGFKGEVPSILTIEWVLSNLLLITPLLGDPWLVPVFWSLLVEVQYYSVIFFILFFSVRWRGPDLTVSLCLVAIVLALVVPYKLHAITSWGTLFVIGHALYRYQSGIGRGWESAGLIAIAFVATYFAHGWLYLIPTALTIVVILWRPPLGRVFLFLGAISYSLYLTHYFIGTRAVRLIERFVSGDFGYLCAYFGATAIAIIVAWLFYLAVEKPSLRWSARIKYESEGKGPGNILPLATALGEKVR